MLDRLIEVEKEILSFRISNKSELEEYRLKYLSRKGIISVFFDELKNVDKSEKPVIGKKLNDLKKFAESLYESKNIELESESSSQKTDMDLSLPGRSSSIGSEHILIQTLNEFCNIFREIGFKITLGPEVEDEFHNFDALNTPDYHPSRDIQDTFYVFNKYDANKKYLLRTHTSPVQVRTMLKHKPPVRVISPGKVYRNETVTMKNYFTFHQIEGLYVDTNVSFRDLRGVLNYFVRRYFGENTKTSFRPTFFPFTEPSAELHVSCFICNGKGCRTCKNSGWIELGGCGMVDPNVFRNVGYDPEIYSGYAFGFGTERLAMMKYGVSDIRLFYQNDVRFLNQF
jgi:phenylalanyl-tRNA synthetase alpha chain